MHPSEAEAMHARQPGGGQRKAPDSTQNIPSSPDRSHPLDDDAPSVQLIPTADGEGYEEGAPCCKDLRMGDLCTGGRNDKSQHPPEGRCWPR